MTRDQIAQRVATNLENSGLSYFPAEMINDAIQDGLDDISAYCGQIEKNIEINFVSKKSYYKLSSLISDYLAPVALYNYNYNRWMIPQPSIQWDAQRWDWENWSGQPLWWDVHDANYIAICPRLDVATGSFEAFYRAKAPTLTANSVPPIKKDYVSLLEEYATGDLLESAKEWTKADGYLKKYFEGRELYKQANKNLADADRAFIVAQKTSLRVLP